MALVVTSTYFHTAPTAAAIVAPKAVQLALPIEHVGAQQEVTEVRLAGPDWARMSNRAYHRESSNAKYWWLKDDEDNFVALPFKLRGDQSFGPVFQSFAGATHYIAGCGRGRDAVRVRIDVLPDGSTRHEVIWG